VPVCVCCFVLLYRYWGIVTVPGSIPVARTAGGPYVYGSNLSRIIIFAIHMHFF